MHAQQFLQKLGLRNSSIIGYTQEGRESERHIPNDEQLCSSLDLFIFVFEGFLMDVRCRSLIQKHETTDQT